MIGLGPVGLSHTLLRAYMKANVVGIDPSSYRRRLARELGARTTIEPDEEINARPAVVIECTGQPASIERALAIVDNGGTVLQSGECHSAVPIHPSDTFIRREVTYTGSWYYATSDYEMMRALIDEGLQLGRLCTHDVPAAKAQDAISAFLDGRTGKVVLRWQ